MLNMQLSLFILGFFLSSCSFVTSSGERSSMRAEWRKVLSEKRWFAKIPSRFLPLNQWGKVMAHPFFDNKPFLDTTKRTLNVYTVNDVDSIDVFDFSLTTGRRYFNYSLCPGRYMGKADEAFVRKWPVSEGFVPLILNQNFTPQRVLIFGNSKEFQMAKELGVAYNVQVLGGYEEVFCKSGDCRNFPLRPELVVLAVDPLDFHYRGVKNPEDLWGIISKEKVQKFIQYYRGQKRKSSGGGFYFWKKTFSLQKVFGSLEKSPGKQSLKNWKKLQRGCFKLYDHFWALAHHGHDLQKIYSQIFSQLEKYGKRLSLCYEVVYPSSINDNDKRFWYLLYLKTYLSLYKIGYHFDCLKQGLVLRYNDEHFAKNTTSDQCSLNSMENLFVSLPNFLQSLLSSDKNSFRFISYDSDQTGTHEKIYDLVRVDNMQHFCSSKNDGKNEEFVWSMLMQKRNEFLENSLWPFAREKK